MAAKAKKGSDAAVEWARAIEETPADSAMREAEKIARLKTHKLIPPPPYKESKRSDNSGQDTLVIPDSHARPGRDGRPADLRRYEWLGRLVTDIQPAVIVDIGDWWDFGSLETFSKKGSVEYFNGSSYWRDVDAGLEARLRFQQQIDIHNRGRRKSSRYDPRKVFCVGNHEHRVSRFLTSDPQGFRFQGLIGLDDLRSAELGWEQIPFLQPVEVSGISFAHYFVSGVKAMPISGVHQASSLVQKQLKSCVMGHTHTFDVATRADASGRHVHGVVCGVFTEERMEYAGPANDLWRRGACVLRNCRDGDFDLEWWSMDRIKARYA